MRLAPLLALLTLAPAAAAAQSAPATAPTPRLGILGGLNSATLSGGGNPLDDNGGGSQNRRNGVAGGLYLTLPLGTSGLAFRPEVLYVQKGAGYRATIPLPPSQGVAATLTGRGDFQLSYVEVPLLLQYAVPAAGGLRPQLYAGVAPAVRTSCKFGLGFSGPSQRFSETADCENIPALLEGDDTRLNFRRVDVGGVVGGALGFDVGGRALAVGVRYTHGFLTLTDDSDSPKNRALGVYGSIEVPLGRPRR